MNKHELIRIAAKKSGVSQKTAEKVVSSILETILESLRNDEAVSMLNFGKFSIKKYDARNGYNVATKKIMTIPEKKVVRFKIAKGTGLK
ncbi:MULTISPECIES: HU family DNA-binding protein [unclassified Butyricimonas]|uniref:HU family DNA-binding protein n=1 Tax=unclassified Butyricimonas TaxID=2637652 RepID=UPI000C06EB5D|nr:MULTISPECIES: HU family DNA-binding protein [unclassified Butyricimonas]